MNCKESNIIHQGDQYALPLIIKMNGEEVTPDRVDDVRVKIGEVLKSYSAGEITYNTETKKYEYPLTESISRSLMQGCSYQVAVKIDDNFIYSAVMRISIGASIITEAWE